jgi:hypothetical protein
MKKLLFTSIWISLVLLASAHTPVLEKATRNFSRDYKGAAGVEWQLLRDGGYLCKFVLDGVTKKAFYDKRGNWSGTVAGYTESSMPREVRKAVLTNYYDYSILYVHEICSPGKSAVYMVQIRDKRTIKILKVANEEVEEVRELEATE